VVVVDASLVLDELLSTRHVALTRRDLAAPPLMWSEATSALHEALWRGALSRDDALDALRRLHNAHVRRLAPANLQREAWRIAEELGWAKTYDAEYVALAHLNRCRLLTRNARLQRAAGRLVKIVGPTEL